MQTIDFIKGKGYKVISFPDGEKHLKIDELNRKDSVDIICRICNSDDLFLLMQLSDILNRQCVVINTITIYYLMTMRCDRLFSFEEAHSLKIIANVVNSFNADKVILVEPHSEVSLSLINNSEAQYVSKGLCTEQKVIFCYPDKGAYLRYNNQYDTVKPIICGKVREESTGALLKFEIINKGDYQEGMTICVVDDLCDGGGTFIGVSKLLRELNPEKLILSVTHAVQKKGIENVSKHYDEVNITNSYTNWEYDTLPINVNIFNY